MKKPTYSVLDLVPIVCDSTIRDAYLNSMALATKVEQLGYHRYWIAEHHNMPGIASAATSIVMSYVASATKTIRIGAGGIMLPNHSPLVIAEQFGTLEAMYPGRIDLGLGRAPGTDRQTMRALRRGLSTGEQDFINHLQELRDYFHPPTSQSVHAIPGEGQDIPIWLLGSSDFSARLAAELGLPFAYASHFSPDGVLPALHLYRNLFKPSTVLEQPHTMVAINVFAADTLEKAERISTSAKLQFLSLIRNQPGKLPAPVDRMDEHWNEQEKQIVMGQLNNTLVGTPEMIKDGLERFAHSTEADEVIVICHTYHFEDRVRTYEMIADVMMI